MDDGFESFCHTQVTQQKQSGHQLKWGEQMQVSIDQAKEVLLGLGKALNDETFEIARRYVNDDMKYVGPFGSRAGAEAYLQEIERLRLKFNIQKIFADDKDVCALL